MWFMASSHHRSASLAALMILFVFLGAASVARADIKGYEFRLVEKETKAGEAIVGVRLIHKPDGRAVPDAVVFAMRLDMAPEGVETMKRPKMMTVVAIMAGLLPMLWSTGAGSEVMQRIAVPMIGGMTSSTFLTLVVIPAIYALIKGFPLAPPRHVTVGALHASTVQ
ncbi:MAG: efflux RND transporter permease subunit [Methylocystis sp.]